jgi:hypothetical protein
MTWRLWRSRSSDELEQSMGLTLWFLPNRLTVVKSCC